MHAAARAVSGVGALGSALQCEFWVLPSGRGLKRLRIAIVRGQGLPQYTIECCVAMHVLQ